MKYARELHETRKLVAQLCTQHNLPIRAGSFDCFIYAVGVDFRSHLQASPIVGCVIALSHAIRLASPMSGERVSREHIALRSRNRPDVALVLTAYDRIIAGESIPTRRNCGGDYAFEVMRFTGYWAS